MSLKSRVVAGWRALRASDSHEDRARREFLSALSIISENQTKQVEAIRDTMVAQAEAFKAYIETYKVEGPSEVWVNRDEDMVAKDEAFLRAKGMPEGLTPVDQLRWVLDNSPR